MPRGLWLVNIGLWMYDAFARQSRMPRHRVFRVNDPATPRVNQQQYRWLCSYYDAQVEFPERFVVAMLQDAQRLSQEHDVPLQVLTYHEATRDGGQVHLRPTRNGKSSIAIRPAAIINAAGAWVDQALDQMGVEGSRLMGGTKGSHFLTKNPALRSALGGNGVYAEASDGRPVFLLTFGEYVLVGTTDLECDASPETVTASEEELKYLRQATREVFPHVDLSPDDIDMHYCGVRPLPGSSTATTAAITRRHFFHENADQQPPIISVVGGKLTTCRALAEEAVERLCERLHVKDRIDSQNRPFPGGEDYPAEDEVSARQQQIAEKTGFTRAQVAEVWRLCGTLAEQQLSAAGDDAVPEPDRRSLPESNLPEWYARRVIREQWVRCLEDLVERRLMLLYEPRLNVSCLERLAQLLADEQVIDRAAIPSEVERCLTRLHHHFGRQLPP